MLVSEVIEELKIILEKVGDVPTVDGDHEPIAGVTLLAADEDGIPSVRIF